MINTIYEQTPLHVMSQPSLHCKATYFEIYIHKKTYACLNYIFLDDDVLIIMCV